MKPNPIPSDMQGFLPYLIVKNAEEAISFYEKAFQGARGTCLKTKDGAIAHAEIKVGNTTIMLAEEIEDWNVKGAKSLGGCPLTLVIYVADVESAFKVAVDAGMTVKKELETHFYGDRMVSLTDPYGYEWCLGHSGGGSVRRGNAKTHERTVRLDRARAGIPSLCPAKLS